MLVAKISVFLSIGFQLCSAELAQLYAGGFADSIYLALDVFWFIKFTYFWATFLCPYNRLSSLLRLGMSVFSGFVKTWVKLPSSALILQFGVLSLVSWVAGLPSVSDVLSEYFPFLGRTLS